jgi:UDP-sugar transporter A1/2/3
MSRFRNHLFLAALLFSNSLITIAQESTQGKNSNLPVIDSKEGVTVSDGDHDSAWGVVFFVLLALQCGSQPVLVKLYMPTTVVRSTIILYQEMTKLLISMLCLILNGTLSDTIHSWSLREALVAAGIPAALFVVQNYCNLMANQTLSPVTFVLLNQTKIISTAWCCFLLLGQPQSQVQVMALLLLLLSTLLVQKILPVRCASCSHCHAPKQPSCHSTSPTKRETSGLLTCDANDDDEEALEEKKGATNDSDNSNEDVIMTRYLLMGVLPAVLASFVSGLAGTLTQKTLQVTQRNPYVFNVELSIVSTVFILLSLFTPSWSFSKGKIAVHLGSPDYHEIRRKGWTFGWTWQTWIPIVASAVGAILVGLVTKTSGAVTKGFAMIFGILISAVLSQVVLRDPQGHGGLSLEEVVGGGLAIISLWIHLTNPPGVSKL